MTDNPDMKTAPKTDQLNYDHIPNGETKTITITRVTGNADAKQPISVHYEGGEGKPYKPCLSMRRVMEAAWGKHAIEYVGKSMILFGDPTVRFGPNAVGGIRISNMSHIDENMSFSLTVSKGIKKPYMVKRLEIEMQRYNVDEDAENKANEVLDCARTVAKEGKEVFTTHFNTLNELHRKLVKTIMPELQEICKTADQEITKDSAEVNPPHDPSVEAGDEAGGEGVTAPDPSATPIDDQSKWLTRDVIIKALDDCGTEEEVDNLITCQSLGIGNKSEGDQIKIHNAAIDRKEAISNG